MHGIDEQNIFLFLLQIFLLLGLARGLGELFSRWGQPALTAEILVGIVLGPTILGRFFPALHQSIFPADMIQRNMLETVGWLGVLFLLLETGLEVDFSSAWRQRGDALRIAMTDVIVPMLIAFPACLLLPAFYLVDPQQRILFAMFMATVMTISAMPVAARALHDLGLSKTDLGFLVMSALSVNDIIGWLLFTLVLSFFTHAELEISRVLIILGAAVAFAVFCLTVGRWLAIKALSEIRRREMPEPATALTFTLLLGTLCGAVTQRIGIHALFGFFLAGVMAGQARALSEQTRQIISQMVYALFVPLFFVGVGLRIDFLTHFDPFLAVFVTVIGIGGRFLGAWLGVRLTQQPRQDRVPISIAHTPGGAMEIVVGLLALEYGLITQPVFVAIVLGAVVSSVVLGPWLGYSISRRKEVSILEYLPRTAVIPDLKADTRQAAIRELSNVAAVHDRIHGADAVSAAVLQREEEMGTGLEEGIAIPHARFRTLDRPVIVFGRSDAGIDWNSPDGKPAHFIFLSLTRQGDDVQVQVLALIARTMRRPEVRERLLHADNPDALFVVLREAFAAGRVVKTSKIRSK